MKKPVFWLIFVSYLFIFNSVSAQDPQNEPANPIDISAAKVEYSVKDGKEVTIFSGDVLFKAPNYQITAGNIELYQGGEKITAHENIQIFYHDKEKNEQASARGGYLEYDRVKGYFMMNISPFLEIIQSAKAKDAEGQEADKIQITALKLEGWTKENRALATGGVEIRRPRFLAKGERAEFFLEEEKIVLTGSPSVTRGRDTFSGEKIIIFLKAGDMIIEGQVRGRVTPPREKERKNGAVIPQAP